LHAVETAAPQIAPPREHAHGHVHVAVAVAAHVDVDVDVEVIVDVNRDGDVAVIAKRRRSLAPGTGGAETRIVSRVSRSVR
jgi:hypothetical protein